LAGNYIYVFDLKSAALKLIANENDSQLYTSKIEMQVLIKAS